MNRLKVIRVYKSCNQAGGVHTRLAELLPRLAEHADVRLLCYRKRGDRADELEDAGVPVDVIPLGSKWAPWNMYRYVRYFRRHRPDVVHTHEYTANTLGVSAAALAGVPVRVRHLHTAAPWGAGKGRRTDRRIRADIRAARIAQLTLAVSRAVRDNYLKKTGLEPSGCRVLYNGIDLSRFGECRRERMTVRGSLGIGLQSLLVGIVGRLTSGKGHAEFLMAAARLTERYAGEVRFVVVGDGGARESLEAQTAELGLKERVVFTGHRRDVPSLLGALDLLVFPSRSEGLPGVVIEAQAAGLPVVASRLPAILEIVEDGRSGMLVPAGDVEGLAAAVERYLRCPELRAAAGRAALTVAARFSVENCVEETLSIYQQLLGWTGGASPSETGRSRAAGGTP